MAIKVILVDRAGGLSHVAGQLPGPQRQYVAMISSDEKGEFLRGHAPPCGSSAEGASNMLLPAKMKRIEIIVHRDYFDSVMRYLRDARLIELLDVKDMLKGYKGAVSPCATSERLYRLATINSKIANLNALVAVVGDVKPAHVGESLSDEQIREIESRASALEQELNAISSLAQACDKVAGFADHDLGANVREMLKINDINSPEGRHRLEEIMFRISDSLRPPELQQAVRLAIPR